MEQHWTHKHTQPPRVSQSCYAIRHNTSGKNCWLTRSWVSPRVLMFSPYLCLSHAVHHLLLCLPYFSLYLISYFSLPLLAPVTFFFPIPFPSFSFFTSSKSLSAFLQPSVISFLSYSIPTPLAFGPTVIWPDLLFSFRIAQHLQQLHVGRQNV